MKRNAGDEHNFTHIPALLSGKQIGLAACIGLALLAATPASAEELNLLCSGNVKSREDHSGYAEQFEVWIDLDRAAASVNKKSRPVVRINADEIVINEQWEISSIQRRSLRADRHLAGGHGLFD